MDTKIISFCNIKGGPGKTNLSYTFTRYLASLGKNVLAIDIDPLASFSLINGIRFPEESSPSGTSFDLFNGDPVTPVKITNKDGSSFDLIPSHSKVSGHVVSPIHFLKESIDEILKSRNYDVVIIDSQGAESNINKSAIDSADIILIPTRATLVDADGAYKSLSQIRKQNGTKGAVLVGLLLNCFSGNRSSISEESVKEIYDGLNDAFCETVIPPMVSLQKMMIHGGQYNLNRHVKRVFSKLYEELLGC